MKKAFQSFWMRFLACVLCTIFALGAIATIVAGMGIITVESQEKNYENGQRWLAENYAAYIYSNRGNELESFMVELEEEVNFDCAIKKVSEDSISTLYSNLKDEEKWDYEFQISEKATVYFHVKSMWDAFRVSQIIHDDVDGMEETPITGYVFDMNTGIFYFETPIGYFEADYIFVCQDNTTYDYKLSSKNGEAVYRNNYYDITLDPTQYENWEWVEINGAMLQGFSEAGRGNTIQLIKDSTVILDALFQDAYYDHESTIEYYSNTSVDSYIIQIDLDETFVKEDMFAEWEQTYDSLYKIENDIIIQFVNFILLLVVSFAFLIYTASGDKESLGFTHKIPILIYTGVWVVVEIALGVFLLDEVIGQMLIGLYLVPIKMAMAALILTIGVMILLGVIYLQNMITRIKAKVFWRYSEFYYISRPIVAMHKVVKEHTSLFWKGFLLLAILSFVELFTILVNGYQPEAIVFWFIVGKAIEIPLILWVLIQMKKLQEGSKRVAAGELTSPIDTSSMMWEFKKHGETINQVSDGIAIAVEERIKSERFKTELITNVSHDIKTPLTSIVNYVDLLKKQDLNDATAKEYVEVLDRQSARLKKLIEDLMEASKASTGNLAVHFEECDVEVLLTQLIGEFEDKLAANQLEVVVSKPAHPVKVIADGRHMWRVLDNLLNNACKYSQINTRVYVTLEQNQGMAQITFKNISKSALNIPSEELLERFVRGDSSRNTEGSGLGLSIAQSLTELMNGTMTLAIDGDLFKVTLTFHAIPMEVKE